MTLDRQHRRYRFVPLLADTISLRATPWALKQQPISPENYREFTSTYHESVIHWNSKTNPAPLGRLLESCTCSWALPRSHGVHSRAVAPVPAETVHPDPRQGARQDRGNHGTARGLHRAEDSHGYRKGAIGISHSVTVFLMLKMLGNSRPPKGLDFFNYFMCRRRFFKTFENLYKLHQTQEILWKLSKEWKNIFLGINLPVIF